MLANVPSHTLAFSTSQSDCRLRTHSSVASRTAAWIWLLCHSIGRRCNANLCAKTPLAENLVFNNENWKRTLVTDLEYWP